MKCKICNRTMRKNAPHNHGKYCQICIKLTPIDKEIPLATHFGVRNNFYQNNTTGNDFCDKCFEQWKK